MYDMYSMNDNNKIDWEVFAAVVLNCLDEQKVMIQELSQKVDELGKYSKESENCIKSDTDQLIGELTNRVSNLEAFDTFGLLQQHEDVMQAFDEEIRRCKSDFYSNLNKCKDEVRIALNRIRVMDASMNDMKRKLQDIKR
jgi:hypothetical protein